MAEQTGISWADATMNPWIGCEKVSRGCRHCYAETWATGWPGTRPGTWGKHGTRERTSPAKWREPLKWAKLARNGQLPNGAPNLDGHRPRVFCASLADVFEERPELDEWRADLFALIEATPELDWLVLTKRPEVARDWLDGRYREEDRVLGELADVPYPNVWLGTSIEDSRVTWRADILRQIPAAVRFISAEPLLGSLYDRREHGANEASERGGQRHVHTELHLAGDAVHMPVLQGGRLGDGHADARSRGDGADASRSPATAPSDSLAAEPEVPQGDAHVKRRRTPLDLAGIDWIIVGGESGHGARPMIEDWVRELRDACQAAGAAFFYKQNAINGRKIGLPELDGRQWMEFPRA